MKLDFLKEQLVDFIVINNNNIQYFKIKKIGSSISVINSEKIETVIFNKGIINFYNLEKSLEILVKKYKFNELGIVLNIPNIIYYRINLPKGKSPYEAILSYLKVNFPLPIEKYLFFYREDKYRSSKNIVNYNIFLILKEFIDFIINTIEKQNIIPLFITHSAEVFYQFFLNRVIIDFNDEYLAFIKLENTLIVLNIKYLNVEKFILEEYNPQLISLEMAIKRIYDFLKMNITPTTKIIFFSDVNIKDIPEITHEKIFLNFNIISSLLEGSYLIFQNVLNEKPIINFSPFKEYTSYLINRIPNIINFLLVYVLILFVFLSFGFLVLNFQLKKEISELNKNLIKITPDISLKNQIENLNKITKKINLKDFTSLNIIKNLYDLKKLENVQMDKKELIFNIIDVKENIDNLKTQIQNINNNLILIEESSFGDKIMLKYKYTK
jgi:hypothetical protein